MGTDEERILELIHHLPDVLWECGFDGRLVFASPSVETLLGYGPEALQAMDLSDLLVADGTDRVEGALTRVLKGRQDVFSGLELPFLHREGHEVWVELSGHLVRDEAGMPHHFQGIARDITLRRQMEAALRQSTKTQSLELMAGGVAHDFNNLLQALMGHLEVLAFHTRDREDLAQACGRMSGIIRKAEGIARQMEDFAFGGEGVPQSMDLSLEVARIQPLLRASLPGRIGLTLDLAEGMPQVLAEPHGLTQVLLDLAANAVQAMEGAGGQVRVRVAAREALAFGEELWVLPPPDPPGAVLEVQDQGPGIPGPILARIFDPFFSTHLQGRGLGLAGVQGRARSFGAGLRVCSAPGQGACFSLVFPAL